MPIALINANVVLADRVLDKAAVIIDAGFIRAVDPERLPPGCIEHDCAGDLLIPGLVDLHADHIEKVLEPRVGSVLPLSVAIDQSDRVNAGAGITTPYHALTFAVGESKVRTVEMAERLARELVSRRPGLLVDHRVHCRYEVTDVEGAPVVKRMVEERIADMISLMDHTPGQGQFQDLDSFIAYYSNNVGIDRETAETMARRRIAGRAKAWEAARSLASVACAAGVAVASHDDDNAETINQHHQLGVSIAEFPVNRAACASAHGLGMGTVLGAPNLLRGGSQSGNMSALDAFLDGTCSSLCSDYVPWSMLPAAWRLQEVANWSLPDAIASVTSQPAAAAGLEDRGRIDAGLRADLVQVRPTAEYPHVITTWCEGRAAFASQRPQRDAAGDHLAPVDQAVMPG